MLTSFSLNPGTCGIKCDKGLSWFYVQRVQQHCKYVNGFHKNKFTIYGEEKPILHLFQRGSYAFFCEKHVSKIMKIINRNCSEMTKMNTVFKCRVGVTVTSCYGKESETVLYLYIILTRVSSYDCC